MCVTDGSGDTQPVGMVAGDAVNAAARIQAAAEPGTVLVDEGNWRVARAAVGFSAAGEFALEGKADPVPLWRADRVLSGVGGSQRVGGLAAPFVGREAELRLVNRSASWRLCSTRPTISQPLANQFSLKPVEPGRLGFRQDGSAGGAVAGDR